MTQTLACPHCGCLLSIPAELVGRSARCPRCRVVLLVPTAPPPLTVPIAQPVTTPAPPPRVEPPPPTAPVTNDLDFPVNAATGYVLEKSADWEAVRRGFTLLILATVLAIVTTAALTVLVQYRRQIDPGPQVMHLLVQGFLASCGLGICGLMVLGKVPEVAGRLSCRLSTLASVFVLLLLLTAYGIGAKGWDADWMMWMINLAAGIAAVTFQVFLCAYGNYHRRKGLVLLAQINLGILVLITGVAVFLTAEPGRLAAHPPGAIEPFLGLGVVAGAAFGTVLHLICLWGARRLAAERC
jgi:hypothetical protein